MQQIAYIEINGTNYVVLVSRKRLGNAIKIASTQPKHLPREAVYLSRETVYLKDNPEIAASMLRGETRYL